MCGITGGFVRTALPEFKNGISRSCLAMSHRGPDGSGTWTDEEMVVLGHVRLAIIDLTDTGSQPMRSFCNRYMISFNGEIYNHIELRKSLENAGHRITYKGSSDTETLLACFSIWGIKKTLQETVGMFALGLWDTEKKELTIARDRFGEKPLHYGYIGDNFSFASELKALEALPGWEPIMNEKAVASFLRHGYIAAPESVYANIFKLMPGCFMTISRADLNSRHIPTIHEYWSAYNVIEERDNEELRFASDDEAIRAFGQVMERSVSGQMLSDVPLGAFLSGGIDSSLTVALMQKNSVQPVKTFSIGFNESKWNEAEYAKAVAAHLGTEHTELYVSHKDALSVVPMLATIYDEPFADASQIPTYLLAKMTREKVTVSLSGDGGDELFGGYSRYFSVNRVNGMIGKLPPVAAKLLSGVIKMVSKKGWDAIGDMVQKNGDKHNRFLSPGEKVYKLADSLSAHDLSSIYTIAGGHWNPADLLKHFNPPKPGGNIGTAGHSPRFRNDFERMMLQDTLHYMPDDVLCKVDRAAMAVSLETRVPFLDQRVYEFAWKLPFHYKIRNGEGKWILKQLLNKYVPKNLIDRPKMGFGVPVDSWLRGPLKDWGADLLQDKNLLAHGLFDIREVQKKWNEHVSGKRNWQYYLWDILMFQQWYLTKKMV